MNILNHKANIALGVIEYGNLFDHYAVFLSVEKMKSCNATPTEQFVFQNVRNFQADLYCNQWCTQGVLGVKTLPPLFGTQKAT